MDVVIVANPTSPPRWTVQAIDVDGDGSVHQTVFSGPDAEQRAREYAHWKYGIADPEIVPVRPPLGHGSPTAAPG
jgi:hypothetical protein